MAYDDDTDVLDRPLEDEEDEQEREPPPSIVGGPVPGGAIPASITGLPPAAQPSASEDLPVTPGRASISGMPPLSAKPPASVTGLPPMVNPTPPDTLAGPIAGAAPSGPNLPADVLSGRMAEPQWKDYRPQHVSLGRKILAGAIGGLAGMRDPREGAEITRSIAYGPQLENYRGDLGEFKGALDQGNRGEKFAEEQGKRGLTEAQTNEANALAEEHRTGAGKTPQERTFAALLKTTNPATGKLYTEAEALQEVQTPKEGELALGAQAGNLNKTLTDRYQVLNPGKALPPEFTLNEKSTQKDYERIDKGLSSLENATGTKAQRDLVSGARSDAAADRRQNAGNARSDKSYQFNSTQLEKARDPVDKLSGRLGNLESSLNQNTPQADALIAPELLSIMAGGAGSGLRMNEAEIARIVGGRSKWEDLKAAVNKWSLDPKTANSITPEQRTEIRALYGSVQQKVAAKQKILEDAEGKLLESDDPKEHRRIVAGARKQLDAIDAAAQGAGGGGGGKTYTDAEVQAAAKTHGMTPQQVEQAYKDKGYTKKG